MKQNRWSVEHSNHFVEMKCNKTKCYRYIALTVCTYKIPPLSQMLTTDPGDSDECYACKLLEVMIIHCHHSLIQVGGSDRTSGRLRSRVGGVGSQVGGIWSMECDVITFHTVFSLHASGLYAFTHECACTHTISIHLPITQAPPPCPHPLSGTRQYFSWSLRD